MLLVCCCCTVVTPRGEGEGISGAVQSVGSRMAKKFPRQADDKNEIDNEITTDDTEGKK